LSAWIGEVRGLGRGVQPAPGAALDAPGASHQRDSLAPWRGTQMAMGGAGSNGRVARMGGVPMRMAWHRGGLSVGSVIRYRISSRRPTRRSRRKRAAGRDRVGLAEEPEVRRRGGIAIGIPS
jgi:hypothetical protein